VLFNSFEFIFLFLPITLLVYFTLARYNLTKISTLSLVIASLVFYSYWDLRYLSLLIGSITFNYTIGSIIEKTNSKPLLTLGIVVNLSLLAYFKYTGFFVQTLNDMFTTSLIVPEIILPLGISFFTFTQTAYLIDAYRGETKHYRFLTYSLFVTVFPHLIAGPILYHKHIIPQFSQEKNFKFSHENMIIGGIFFMVGLVKKVMIADMIAKWVNPIFTNPSGISFSEGWFAALGYTLQLYFDFSAYSEMAIGLGLMFNLKLPINFNSPYKSLSIIDFWRRWHITLSEFLKNYLYIPLGGNRHGNLAKMKNLIITMFLGGLWHGAGWTFIIWGALHGIYLVINHGWRRLDYDLPKWLSWSITFLCVVIAWVFFRANSVNDAMQILHAMLGLNGIILPIYLGKLSLLSNASLIRSSAYFCVLLMLLIITLKLPNIQQIYNYSSNSEYDSNIMKHRISKYVPIVLGILFFFVLKIIAEGKPSDFLYFNF